MIRTSYHTSLKELVKLDILPDIYLKKIPRTNINRWRNDNYERFKGAELNEVAEKHKETITSLNHFPKLFYAAGRLASTLIKIAVTTKHFESQLREHKESVIETLLKVREVIPIKKAIKFFGISKGTFHSWVIDTKLKCSNSFFKQCVKVRPNQITPMEVKAIKKALMNPLTFHWSIKSVYDNGIRNGKLSVSENTMYKINKVLGIRSRKNTFKKKRHKEGIRAERPNQYWHADITKVKTLNNKWYCVYLVVDNYSRCILSYEIHDTVSGLVTKSTLEEAYEKAKKVTSSLNVNLIVDGGPENNNIYVNGFIEQSEINMKKLIALKDIKQSNSIVERVNRTLKYQYIFPKQPRDLKHLKRILRYFIQDYNVKRPHGMLNGSTPEEAWKGIKIRTDLRTEILKQARINRLVYNKKNECGKC